jgi:hypothetical protein
VAANTNLLNWIDGYYPTMKKQYHRVDRSDSVVCSWDAKVLVMWHSELNLSEERI